MFSVWCEELSVHMNWRLFNNKNNKKNNLFQVSYMCIFDVCKLWKMNFPVKKTLENLKTQWIWKQNSHKNAALSLDKTYKNIWSPSAKWVKEIYVITLTKNTQENCQQLITSDLCSDGVDEIILLSCVWPSSTLISFLLLTSQFLVKKEKKVSSSRLVFAWLNDFSSLT